MAEEQSCPEPPKCPECPPAGLPGWMATFSDMVTLLLTFFILLYALSKQDDTKYQAVAGSIRNAFGGNTKNLGAAVVPGKSPSDSSTMLESEEPAQPFPIDFLTTDGILDKLEVNRESTEDLNEFKDSFKSLGLEDSVNIYEVSEGIKVRIKDKIYFKEGSVEIDTIEMEVFKKIIKLLQSNKDMKIFIEGHASPLEKSKDGKDDAFILSARRAEVVSRYLIKKGVKSSQITSVFYSDSRPLSKDNSSRVEFILRKVDLINDPSEKHVSPY